MNASTPRKRTFAFVLSLLLVLQMLVPSASLQAIAEEMTGGGDSAAVVEPVGDDEPQDAAPDAAPEEAVPDDEAVDGDGEGDDAAAPKAPTPSEVAVPAAADLLAALPTPVTEGDDAPAAQAADTTVGSLTISGGTAGVDYTVSGTTVVVQTGTPLTFKGTLTNGTVQIKQGTSANITLNGATITSNTNSSPINLMGTGTTLRLFLADGTTNTITVSSPSSVFCAGIHCGAGSTLYIDDSVANWSGSTHVEVLNGVVDTTATLDNGTAVAQGDPVTRLASPDPGKLVVRGGGGSAAIGSGSQENAGNMIFDGGVITAYVAGGHANNGGTNANHNWSSGTGIAAGAAGSPEFPIAYSQNT